MCQNKVSLKIFLTLPLPGTPNRVSLSTHIINHKSHLTEALKQFILFKTSWNT